jgi:hypothetical protein
LQRIDPDRLKSEEWRLRKRERDRLPKRITETLKAGQALTKEAKGLGRRQ